MFQMFRQILRRIRYEQKHNFQQFNILLGLILGSSILVSLLIDLLLPFHGVYNILRTFILIPLASSVFAFAYEWGNSLHNMRMNSLDEPWTPYRVRHSLKTRQYIAMPIAGLLFVLILGTGYGVGYTLMSSLFVAGIIALLAYIRPTHNEEVLLEMNIPDSRDVRYDAMKIKREAEKERLRKENEEKVKIAEEEAKNRRRKIFKKNTPSSIDELIEPQEQQE